MGRVRIGQTKAGSFKKTDLFAYLRNIKGFTYLELLISISFLSFMLLFLASLLLMTINEKNEQRNTMILQHSYQIGYQYLRSEVLKSEDIYGGGLFPFYLQHGEDTQVFRTAGDKVIRSIRKGIGPFEGSVVVFEYVDQIRFEVLPNHKGIRLFGQLKEGNSIFSFDEVILRRVGQ
ncbi:hypothetical protein TEPIDINF_000606 [Tepidibacillus infernus]|uniref:hypothetical protein n=1 Tax=Tepidibacillus infernus TaxID=1806172 RepID=UPI003A2B3977